MTSGTPWLVLILAAVGLYFVPLTSPDATVQWDAIDVHYSLQRYLAEQLHAGLLPFWTPYLFSGFPFLADPLVGAWYPLNWPFIAAGISPKSIEGELFVHAILATSGAYLLARRLTPVAFGALLAGCFYGLSGFFAGRSAHVGMFQTAALFPWLLLAFVRALERPTPARVVIAGALEGALLLAGHFQTALYATTALMVFAVAEGLRSPGRRTAQIVATLAVFALGLGVAAVQILPGLELEHESMRASMDPASLEGGIIPPDALLTLVNPNWYGIFDGHYTGPEDITQYYFYAGICLVPLAAIGLLSGGARRLAGLLIVPWAWYAAAPTFGGIPLLAHLPGFSSVRNPVNAWFLIGLGLALLAGAGFATLRRVRFGLLASLILPITLLDLFVFNAVANPLAYAHQSYAVAYGQAEEALRSRVTEQPLEGRIHGGRPSISGQLVAGFGSLNHSLDLHLPATYGYDPLELRRYDTYFRATFGLPDLVAGFSVSNVIPGTPLTRIDPYDRLLPLAYFPNEVEFAQALGVQICRQRRRVVFTKTNAFLADLAGGRAEGNWQTRLRRYLTPDLVILDDFAMREYTLTQAEDLYELVKGRYRRGSLILTSNREPKDLYDLFPTPVIAEGLLDRLLNSAYMITMLGRSYRPQQRPGTSTSGA